MLGDLIYEAKGKTLGLRVLDDNGTMEMTNMENGVVLGTECTTMVTLVCKRRPDGTQYSEGHAVISTKDGDAATSVESTEKCRIKQNTTIQNHSIFEG